MTQDFEPINLTHHFLIAMPGLMDESFNRSVVYMCEHSDRGALGLIINKPSTLRMQDLFEKVEQFGNTSFELYKHKAIYEIALLTSSLSVRYI